MTALAVLFWACAGLVAYTHVGYPLVLKALVALRRRPTLAPGRAWEELPRVSLIVAAYDEEEVIAAKVANALALDYPRERLELIVASDGSADATAERARAAGADLVIELPRGGKVAAQNAAAERASGEILAFSDANSAWAPDALRHLVEPFADPAVGYVCGQVRFLRPDPDPEFHPDPNPDPSFDPDPDPKFDPDPNPGRLFDRYADQKTTAVGGEGGDNPEGAYWRYEMAVREMESALAGITAGNGAIYAVRREAYVPLPPSGSHDLSFPFRLAKRGLRSLYVPWARAEEKMVPTLEGELARKRRMMVGLWDIVVGEGMLRPRGYPALYAFELASHRLLRYLSPLLHLIALAANLALLGHGWVYAVTLAAQLALLAAALLGRWLPLAPLRVARYYLMTTASIPLGLWDRFRRGRPGTWEKAEGTR
jgi:cellulose synthase/poly-beta-1,6-N-acetylglucosamine synthase-like glycosyltransferase